MKKLVLVIGLILTVCFGFAKDYRPKVFTTDIYIGDKYEDGKIKYAITEDEIIDQIVEDYTYYFEGIINSRYKRTDKMEKIEITSCRFRVIENDNVVFLKASYSFFLLSSSYDRGIPLYASKSIMNKLVEISEEAWQEIEDDPVIAEIQGL